jgi:hypothetical protein
MSFEMNLDLTASLIAEQAERIARQEELIRRLEDAGLPSKGSQDRLNTLNKLLNALRERSTETPSRNRFQSTRRKPPTANGTSERQSERAAFLPR